MHRLDDARAKVSRANEHLDAVREELKRDHGHDATGA